jgi:hypothetical protein
MLRAAAATGVLAVGLVVTGATSAAAVGRHDFAIIAGPATVTVHRGHPARYTIELPRGRAFTAGIAMRVTGLPRHTSAGFTPFGTGIDPHRSLSVATHSSTPTGTYRLTLIASGGHRTHRAHVSLVVHR